MSIFLKSTWAILLLVQASSALATEGELSRFHCYGVRTMPSEVYPEHAMMIHEASFIPGNKEGDAGQLQIKFTMFIGKDGRVVDSPYPVTRNEKRTVYYTKTRGILESSRNRKNLSADSYFVRFDVIEGKGKVEIETGFERFSGFVTCSEFD